MKKQINFGTYEIDGYKNKKTILVDIELRDKNGGNMELSIYGQIGLGDVCISGGQNLDEIAEYIKGNELFNKLHRWWTLYHLNGMHAECEHQYELGWHKDASREVKRYEYRLKSDIRDERSKLESTAITYASNRVSFHTTAREQTILKLPYYSIHTYNEKLDDDVAKFFEPTPYRAETKLLGFVRPTEHPDGLLCKPCPVCGYERGSAWKFHAIPQAELDKIIKLLQGVEK